MRILAIINQKGGVGKTTTVANLGAALARAGQRVVVFDLDPQANLSLYLGSEVGRGEASVYGVLTEGLPIEQSLRATATPNLQLVPSHLDLSGAELELASTLGRETLLRDALQQWVADSMAQNGQEPADFVILDCPPSLGLLSVNALVAANEVMIAVQTEFFALQGLSKLVEVIQLLRRRMNPGLSLTGIIPCLYDSRLKLAREVLVELRKHFPGKVFQTPVRTNVRLAESPSFGQTIFEYAPDSNGAKDYQRLGREVLGHPPVPPTAPRSAVAVVADEQAQELQRAAEGLKDLEAPNTASESGPSQSQAARPGGDSSQPGADGPSAGPERDAQTSPQTTPRGETPPRSEVDAELAAYEIPRTELARSEPRRRESTEDQNSSETEEEPHLEQNKASVSREPEALTPAIPAQEHPSEEAQQHNRGQEGLTWETYTHNNHTLGRTYLPTSPETASSTALLEAPSAPELTAEVEQAEADSPPDTQPDLETVADSDEEAGPPATPVFGFSHYIGEDRWTQRPRA